MSSLVSLSGLLATQYQAGDDPLLTTIRVIVFLDNRLVNPNLPARMRARYMSLYVQAVIRLAQLALTQ
jgi:hypothetical protein